MMYYIIPVLVYITLIGLIIYRRITKAQKFNEDIGLVPLGLLVVNFIVFVVGNDLGFETLIQGGILLGSSFLVTKKDYYLSNSGSIFPKWP